MNHEIVTAVHTEHADSIITEEIFLEDDATPQQRHVPLTPAKVLSWLPADATPAQQDSAIQAHIKPSEIHWSECPDTLHLPGHPAGRSFRDVSLPKYYRESYFEGKPCFNPDLFGGRQGVAGDPVPYSIARDNVITILLLACFMLALIAYAKSRRFILRQVKDFFRAPRGENMTVMTETSGEFRFQFFLVGQSCLLFALIYFFYVQTRGADTFIVDQYQVIGIFAAIIFGYAVFKAAAYSLTGFVFFDHKRNELWMKSFLFLLAMEGVCVFPLVMLQAYFGMAVEATLVCTAVVIVVFKMLAFWRTYIIFFRREGLSLQIFLYFCTLEVMPVTTLLGILAITSNYLKVKI